MEWISQSFSGISIKNKIFITTIFVIVISITTLAVFANLVSQNAIIEKAENNSLRELVLIDNNLHTLITTVEDYSKILATDYRLQNELYNDFLNGQDVSASRSADGLENLSMKKTLSEVISNIVEPNTNIKAASILTANRQWVDVGFADNDFAARLFGFSLEGRSNVPTWTGLLDFKFRYEGHEPVFAVTKTVIHKDTGETIGMVVLYVKEAVFASIYQREMNYKGGKFFILEKSGSILSSQDKENLHRSFAEATSISELELNGNNASFIHAGEGETVLVSTNPFEPLQWTIVSVLPIEEITAERKEINQVILRIGALCLLLALAVSFLLSRSITRPIFRLAKTMRDIRNGRLNVRNSYRSENEIGYLSDGFNNLMDRIEALMAENVEEQRMKAESEFKLLQAQLKPHFLYNTIETILSLVKLDMKSEAAAAAKGLADFYKISLSKGSDIITIREEMQLTQSYLQIQQLRYVEYMESKMEIDDEILGCPIPKLTLQPIVENAIYHGLKRKTEKGLLRIVGYRHEDEIRIEILDDGVGIEAARIRAILQDGDSQGERSSFGAQSVHNRIRILYGDRYGLEVESVVGAYTKVVIHLPFVQLREARHA